MYRSSLFLLVLLTGCAQVTPAHDIPVKPEYIKAGIQVGDTIEVTTLDGEVHRFEVVDVQPHEIAGPDGAIAVTNIRSIKKRSWTVPIHPCGNNEPVGCSIPDVVLVISSDYAEQAEKYHPACVTHDFCYRHGFATYGLVREQCDAEFLQDMKQACAGYGGLGRLDVEQYGICQLAASQTYEAVRRKGEPSFRTTGSTYCEYRPDP
jgi:hypothetical protein